MFAKASACTKGTNRFRDLLAWPIPDESPSGKDEYASNFQQDSKVERIREVSLFGMLPRFQVLCLPLLKKFGRSRSPEFSTETLPLRYTFLLPKGAGMPLTYFCVISTC